MLGKVQLSFIPGGISMERPTHLYLVHGVIGGVVAGSVVALWFLVRDLATTEVFYTPALLASALMNEEFIRPTARLVAYYTVLHFGVFAALGLGTGALLRVLKVSPGLLVGGLFGLGVLSAVHYGSAFVTKAEFWTLLPAIQVLAANLLGGMAMMAYLHRAVHADTPLGLAVLKGHPLLVQGIVTGLWGAGAVALWFFTVDVISSLPFYTPAALGSALFLGATNAGEVQVNAGIIGAYTFVHISAFAAVGVAFVWVAERIERAPGLWLLALMSFIVVEGLFVATAGVVSEWVLGSLGWWAVGIGNLVGVATMGWRVWVTHPALKEKLVHQAVTTQV